MSDMVRLEKLPVILCAGWVLLSTLPLYFFQIFLRMYTLIRTQEEVTDHEFRGVFSQDLSPLLCLVLITRMVLCPPWHQFWFLGLWCSQMCSRSCVRALLTENTATHHSALHISTLPPGSVHLPHGILYLHQAASHVSIHLLSHFWKESIFPYLSCWLDCHLDTRGSLEKKEPHQNFLHLTGLWEYLKGHFIEWWLRWLDAAHCGWCYPWEGGPGCYEKADWASQGEQVT